MTTLSLSSGITLQPQNTALPPPPPPFWVSQNRGDSQTDCFPSGFPINQPTKTTPPPPPAKKKKKPHKHRTRNHVPPGKKARRAASPAPEMLHLGLGAGGGEDGGAHPLRELNRHQTHAPRGRVDQHALALLQRRQLLEGLTSITEGV